MKKLLKMSIILVIISLFSLPASAKEAEDYIDDFEDELPDGYENILSDGLPDRIGPKAILAEIGAILDGNSSRVGGFFLTLLGCLSLSFFTDACPVGTREGVKRGISLISGVTVGGEVCRLLIEAASAQSVANRFFSSVIPIFSAVTLAGGGVEGAAVGAAGMNLVASVVGGAFAATLSAVAGFSVAMSLAACAGGSGSAAVNRSAKGLFLWIFGISTTLLMGTLSLQTMVSSAADSATMRTAKYMASTAIPVAGGAVSASLSTLASGLAYAKGLIGGGAIFVIAMLFLSPLVMLLLYRLALSTALLLARLCGIGGVESIFSSFQGAIDLTVAVYSLSAILYIFEIILFVKSGVAIL